MLPYRQDHHWYRSKETSKHFHLGKLVFVACQYYTFEHSIKVIARQRTDSTTSTTENSVHKNKGNCRRITFITDNSQLRTTVEGEETKEENETSEGSNWNRVTRNIVLLASVLLKSHFKIRYEKKTLTENFPTRGPMKIAPISAAIPPHACTIPDPAKSVNAIGFPSESFIGQSFASHPPPHPQWETTG